MKHPQKKLSTLYKASIAPYRTRLKWAHMDRETEIVEGSADFPLTDQGFVLFCGFKNAASCMGEFIEHYQRLGCIKFFFFDDGSTDDSREVIRENCNAIVFESSIPYIKNFGLIRGWFLDRFAKNRWAVMVDHDEFLDYPYSDEVTFTHFLSYLDGAGFEGAVACMLDRFSDKAIGDSGYVSGANLSELFPYYDLSSVKRFPFLKLELGLRGSVGNDAVCDYYGGVRGKHFGFWPRLLKTPLLKYRSCHGVRQHMVGNAKLADLSLLLHHYRYMDEFVAQTKLAECGYARGGINFSDLDKSEALSVYDPATAMRWEGFGALDKSYFYVSPQYERWALAQTEDSVSHGAQ